MCRDKWAAAGLAELRPTPGRVTPRWFVREDADPAFARVRTPDQVGADLRQYTQDQRDGALRRRRLLAEWDAFCATCLKIGYDRVRATNTFVERKLLDAKSPERVSRTQLYAWAAAYKAEGLAGLVDGRGGRRKPADAGPDPFLAEVQRFYLSPRQPKLTVCVRMAELTAHEQGWTVRSYKACERHIKALPAALVIKMRAGEDAYVARAEPYIERDYTTLDSNGAWNADHHQFDVIVDAGGKLLRPWLTVFQDVRSRKIVGWSIFDHAPNTDVILGAFRQAVLAHGVPDMLFIDNGKDYDSHALNGRTKRDRWAKQKVRVELDADRAAGLFPSLGIDVRHVWPYHGQSKPVERWFGGMELHTTCWATYCGRSPAHKPEDLQLQLERGKAPLLADFTAWFGDWLAAYDAGQPRAGDGMDGRTPDQVYAEHLHVRRTAPADLIDLLCLRRVAGVKVGRNGVTWQGVRYGQYEPALQRLLGADVVLRVDERDVTRVQVYDAQDRFVCVAPSNARLPFAADAQSLRQAINAKRQDRKLLGTYQDRRPRMADDLPERIVSQMAARAAALAGAAGDPPPPPNVSPVRHALEGQLDAVQRAADAAAGRQAVGAESVPLPGRFLYGQTPASRDEAAPAGPSFRSLMGTHAEDRHE